ALQFGRLLAAGEIRLREAEQELEQGGCFAWHPLGGTGLHGPPPTYRTASIDQVRSGFTPVSCRLRGGLAGRASLAHWPRRRRGLMADLPARRVLRALQRAGSMLMRQRGSAIAADRGRRGRSCE